MTTTTTTIIKHDDFKITQDERNQYIFNIDFSPYTNSQILIQSITKTNILKGTTMTTMTKTNTNTNTTTNTTKTLQFKATKVSTFTQYKESQLKKKHYTDVLLIVHHLVTQLEYLIKNTQHVFIGYNPKNIIVIDDNKFIYLSNEHLLPIENNNMISITCPFSTKDFFFSPELKRIKEIPTKINYKTSYYSLACLIMNIFQEENQQDQQDQQLLDSLPIKNTKLYWLLQRCLNEDPNKRSILFI